MCARARACVCVCVCVCVRVRACVCVCVCVCVYFWILLVRPKIGMMHRSKILGTADIFSSACYVNFPQGNPGLPVCPSVCAN